MENNEEERKIKTNIWNSMQTQRGNNYNKNKIKREEKDTQFSCASRKTVECGDNNFKLNYKLIRILLHINWFLFIGSERNRSTARIKMEMRRNQKDNGKYLLLIQSRFHTLVYLFKFIHVPVTVAHSPQEYCIMYTTSNWQIGSPHICKQSHQANRKVNETNNNAKQSTLNSI